MTPIETVALAYERWAQDDFDGFLDLFASDAVFVVPGATRVSGDHDKKAFRAVLESIEEATRAGRHRQELVCTYEGESGVVAVFDTFLGGPDAAQYHSAHEWIFRDGVPHVWMLYVHEYDVFDAAWR